MTDIKMKVGEYLFHRIKELGVKHVLGVPGDFNLQLIEQIYAADDLSYLNICNELNAAYAADGYARMNGCAALLTTYGVGDLSALNGVAGAWAEHVPVVCVSGAPPVHAIHHHTPVHHSAADGNFSNVMNCFREFTAAQSCLNHANAVEEIDRVIKACWREKRPVYIQVPSDIAWLEVSVNLQPLFSFEPSSDEKSLRAAVAFLAARLKEAHAPAFLVDMDVARYHLKPAVQALAERLKIPLYSLASGKCVVDETHPLYRGIYNGAASAPAVKEGVEKSDCLLAFSPRFIEGNSALYTHNLPVDTLLIHPHDLRCGNQAFTGIRCDELMQALANKLAIGLTDAAEISYRQRNLPPVQATSAKPLTHAFLWRRIAHFLRENDVIFAENGTSNIALTGVDMPTNVTYVAQPLWGSIGFTLPALLGSLIHDDSRRHLLFIGDGSFQLTAQEMSTLLALKYKPLIFLLNNKGYTIERYILGPEAQYNDVAEWKYTDLVSCFGQHADAVTAVVNDEGELEEVLCRAERPESLTFIQLNLDPMDAPDPLRKFGKMTADFDYGPYGPQ